jgi:hypothetical protein
LISLSHKDDARALTPAYLSLKNCLHRAVPHPFYYRRVERRKSLLTAFGIVLGCGVAFLLLIFFIHVYFSG